MRWTYIGIGVACVGIVCIASLLFDSSHATPRPRTYQEAVMQALDRRGIVYTAVWVGGLCQPEAQCWESWYGSWYNSAPVYVADVVVEEGRPVSGRIECVRAGEDCVLLLAGDRSDPIPLPPLASESPWLWVIRRRAEAIEVQLRAWFQRLRQP